MSTHFTIPASSPASRGKLSIVSPVHKTRVRTCYCIFFPAFSSHIWSVPPFHMAPSQAATFNCFSEKKQLSCSSILCQKPSSYLDYFKANLHGRGAVNSLTPLLGYHQQHDHLLEIIMTTCTRYLKFSQSSVLIFVCLPNIWLLPFSGTILHNKLSSETYICLWKTRIIKILLKAPKIKNST